MTESMNYWQLVFVLAGILCISNGIIVTVNNPKNIMIDFAAVSQMIFGIILIISIFLIPFYLH